MAAFEWRHDKSKSEVREAVKSELRKLGYESKVAWADYRFTSSIGFGTVLSLAGEISEKTIILEKCDGVARGKVLEQFQNIVKQLFPDGEKI